MLWEHE